MEEDGSNREFRAGRPSDRMRLARESASRRRRGRAWLYAVLGLFCLIVIVPPVVDFGKGMLASDGDCRLVRVIEGDRFRVRCPVIGGQAVQLMGAAVPGTSGVECFSEFVAGYRAKWAARWILWTAGSIRAEADGFGWTDRTLVSIQADGEGLPRLLVEAGHGRWDDGYSDIGWCYGEKGQLDQ